MLDCANGHQEKDPEKVKVEEVQENRSQEGNRQDGGETFEVCGEEPDAQEGEEEGRE